MIILDVGGEVAWACDFSRRYGGRSKMEAVLNWERPKNASEVNSFLGLDGYY